MDTIGIGRCSDGCVVSLVSYGFRRRKGVETERVKLTLGRNAACATVDACTSSSFVEETARAVDGTIEALMEAIDDVPTLLLHDVANVADDGQAVLASLPLVILRFWSACLYHCEQFAKRR